MRKELLDLMQENYKTSLISAKINNELYNIIDELKQDDKVQKYIELYQKSCERGIKGLEDSDSVLKKTVNSFSSSINDVKEINTNQIYFLTRKDVYELNCSKNGFIYDDFYNGNIRYYDNVLNYSFGDIFTNIENDKYWKFVPKNRQEEFKKDYIVIYPEDVSLYYLAHKDFYETAITEGEEAAIKKVLSKRY